MGDEPDYRFTLANERTFLAWMRTALAMAAGGIAVVDLLEDLYANEYLGIGLLLASFLTAATGYRRWFLNERSMRLGEPLPASRLPLLLATITALAAVAAALLFVLGEP